MNTAILPAVFIHHGNKGHAALKHHLAVTGLGQCGAGREGRLPCIQEMGLPCVHTQSGKAPPQFPTQHMEPLRPRWPLSMHCEKDRVMGGGWQWAVGSGMRGTYGDKEEVRGKGKAMDISSAGVRGLAIAMGACEPR